MNTLGLLQFAARRIFRYIFEMGKLLSEKLDWESHISAFVFLYTHRVPRSIDHVVPIVGKVCVGGLDAVILCKMSFHARRSFHVHGILEKLSYHDNHM